MLPFHISPYLADDIHGHPDVFLDEETVLPFSLRVNDAEGTVKQVVGRGRRASLTSIDSQASGCWESKLSCITANSKCVGTLCYTSETPPHPLRNAICTLKVELLMTYIYILS